MAVRGPAQPGGRGAGVGLWLCGPPPGGPPGWSPGKGSARLVPGDEIHQEAGLPGPPGWPPGQAVPEQRQQRVLVLCTQPRPGHLPSAACLTRSERRRPAGARGGRPQGLHTPLPGPASPALPVKSEVGEGSSRRGHRRAGGAHEDSWERGRGQLLTWGSSGRGRRGARPGLPGHTEVLPRRPCPACSLSTGLERQRAFPHSIAAPSASVSLELLTVLGAPGRTQTKAGLQGWSHGTQSAVVRAGGRRPHVLTTDIHG